MGSLRPRLSCQAIGFLTRKHHGVSVNFAKLLELRTGFFSDEELHAFQGHFGLIFWSSKEGFDSIRSCHLINAEYHLRSLRATGGSSSLGVACIAAWLGCPVGQPACLHI